MKAERFFILEKPPAVGDVIHGLCHETGDKGERNKALPPTSVSGAYRAGATLTMYNPFDKPKYL